MNNKTNLRRWTMKRSIVQLVMLLLAPLIYVCCNHHPYPQGQRLYEYHCERCHGADFTGFEALYPDISHSAYIQTPKKELACLISKGSAYLTENPVESGITMPANPNLNAIEIFNIMNYIYFKTGVNSKLTLSDIESSLEQCQ